MNTQTEPMEASRQCCPNLDCKARGQLGQGNIVIHSRKRPRSRCKTCGKTFSAKEGTLFAGLRKPTEVIVVVITLLASGCPVQAIVHAFGLDEPTVANWRDRAGNHSQHVHQAVVEQGKLDLVHVQADEIRIKGCKMIAWMGLCAVSVHMKFLRNAGEGESKLLGHPTHLAWKHKGKSSMLGKRRISEGMYETAPQVLCAW